MSTPVGYLANEDWWNFDVHLCGYIADAVEKFATEGVTDWEQTLPDVDLIEDIVVPLRRYAGHKFSELDEAEDIYNDARVSLHLFVHNLGTWWD